MAANKRFSVASLASLSSLSSGSTGVDASFISLASTTSTASSSFEIESEVGREAVKEICCSALSRILDFPDDQLEVLLGYDEDDLDSSKESGMNVAKNIAASFRMMRRALSHKHTHPPVKYTTLDKDTTDGPTALTFGGPLLESNQPALFLLISHIQNFVTAEGLFRKPGNKHRMESLVADLEADSSTQVFNGRKYNAHDYASILKKYLSELSEPLLIKRHLDAYLQTAALSTKSSKVCCLQLLMLLLPPINRAVFQRLLDLLCQVARQPENLMDAQNLGLVFAPTLFLASKHESLAADCFEKLSSLVKLMIEKPEEIFEVPTEVQVVAERYLRRKRTHTAGSMDSLDAVDSNDSVAIDIYSTACQQESSETFHQNGQDNAASEVAALYEIVRNMPDGPQKTHFLKRFESASKMQGTPVYSKYKKVSKSTSKKAKKNKENAPPEIVMPMPCFKKGSLMQEFDLVDNHTKPLSKSKSSENILKTPVTRGFAKPPIANGPRARMISTMSPLVTDV